MPRSVFFNDHNIILVKHSKPSVNDRPLNRANANTLLYYVKIHLQNSTELINHRKKSIDHIPRAIK